MNARRGVAVIAAACACRTLVGAATMDSLEVSRSHDRYRLLASAHLDATPESIYTVLTDYGDNGFSRISGAYKESGFLAPDTDGTPIVFTRMEGCLLRHCMTFNRVERLETEEPFHIRSVTLPMQSNFKYATSDWRLDRDGAGGTNLKYELEMEPDFWIPPLIGPWYLKRTLAQGGARAVTRIEALARAIDGAPRAASFAASPP
jgi:hypothetical protein